MGLVPWHIDVVPSQLLFDSSILHTQDILCHIVCYCLSSSAAEKLIKHENMT